MGDTCHELHDWANGRQRFRFPFDSEQIPRNGIYILLEKGERAHGGDRIVRVGTHTGNDQMPSRLAQHFLMENKDRSIFRKNIGRAILAKRNDPFGKNWEICLTTREARRRYEGVVDVRRQAEIEGEVSTYIRSTFSFVVFDVPDKTERLRLESRLIGAVSLCEDCQPSAAWLGHHSPKEKIRESGLWLVNELYKEALSSEDLAILRGCR